MRTITSIFILLLCLKVFSQTNELEIKNQTLRIYPDAFILGTFSDLNGRFQYIDKENQIDRYNSFEKSLGKYISYFIKRYYDTENELTKNPDNSLDLLVPKIAKRLNYTFYNENGNLIYEKLKNDEEKLSYLLGIYYRFGEKLDNDIYQIKINSYEKKEAVYRILNELECENIILKNSSNKSQNKAIFYFEPTLRIIKYFKTLEQEKTQLEFESLSFEINSDNKNEKKNLIKNLNKIFD